MASRFRYGVHAYLWTDHWSEESLGLLDHARELGAELFEIPLGEDVECSEQAVRRRGEEVGLELTVGPGGQWPPACDLSSDDPDERARALSWHAEMIQRAAKMGAVAYCGAIYGRPGTVQRRRPPADEYPRTAAGLHELAELARTLGLRLLLEPMSRFRTHLVNTPAQALELVNLADHPNLGIILDTYHMVTEVRDYAAGIRCVGDRLWGVHACENDRGVPGGGLVPWDAVFGALVEVQPQARIMLETYNTSIGDHGYRRGMFQNQCPDGDAFVSQAFAFLKSRAAAADRRLEAAAPGPAGSAA